MTPEQTLALELAISLIDQACKLAARFGQAEQLKAALRQRMAAMFDGAEADVREKHRKPVLLADGGMPRRARLDLLEPAERAIVRAVDAVESMGADVRLTDAVVALGKARDHVADVVDERKS
jgi:hypothetical protein